MKQIEMNTVSFTMLFHFKMGLMLNLFVKAAWMSIK